MAKSLDTYVVGWVCALPTETAAAIGMLDEGPDYPSRLVNGQNNYAHGRIGRHNVAIACLPAGITGATTAATVASQMLVTFPSMKFGLLVGIGGGAPCTESDIRLGDVVVSQPSETSGGVQEGRFVCTGFLNSPPPVLLNAAATLSAKIHA